MDFFQAVVLAVIQGISAWIPVSSKTQVILAGTSFFGLTLETALAFALALHIGDLIAALVKYRTEYLDAFKQLLNPQKITHLQNGTEQESRFLVLSIFATALVALPAYVLFRKHFSGLSGEPLLFAIGAVLLAMAAITWRSKKAQLKPKELGLTTTLITGAAQGLAVIPGISRSGITQSALILQGIPQEKAMRLSFLMSAPMILAAIVAFQFVQGFSGLNWTMVAIGIAVSAAASFLTMDALSKIARQVPAHLFMAAVGLLAMVPAVLLWVVHVSG